MKDILENLNSMQREAVSHIEGPLLILAGAGSGKTKTITTRLAFLIKEVGIPADSILTLTFTNKAAKEMKERAFNMLGIDFKPLPLLCTFHKFGLLFLRKYIKLLNRDSNFNVIDTSDKVQIIKRLNKENKYSSLNDVLSYISNAKSNPKALDSFSSFDKEYKIYSLYENYLTNNNLVDYDDLILLTFNILNEFSDVRNYISNKYQYIMVDEYQDTNILQYKLLRLLCSNHSNICVVGDDDQSIYSWRGANIKNILDFPNYFKDSKSIKLEHNYRSYQEILEAANYLISHNNERFEKKLQSTRGNSNCIKVISANNDKEEIKLIIEQIKKLIIDGEKLSDIAILFRISSITLSLEETFNKHKIPFKAIGLMKFYERAEIKDVIAYIRYVLDENDDFSLRRIINKPIRGIGNKSLDSIFEIANNVSVAQCFRHGAYNNFKFYKSLCLFFDSIERMKTALTEGINSFVNFLERNLVLYVDEDRIFNIQTLYSQIRRFVSENCDLTLKDFLDEIGLSSSADEIENDDCIMCMSVHSSKGLEFNNVFIMGFEEDIFPYALYFDLDLEEERRLAYVAFTRAKNKLFITYAKTRQIRNQIKRFKPSSFFYESKIKKIEYKTPFNLTPNNVASRKKEEKKEINQENKLVEGDIVFHKMLGHGKLIKFKDRYSAFINFGGNIRIINTTFLQKI